VVNILPQLLRHAHLGLNQIINLSDFSLLHSDKQRYCSATRTVLAMPRPVRLQLSRRRAAPSGGRGSCLERVEETTACEWRRQMRGQVGWAGLER
jgi:hypothetical protein